MLQIELDARLRDNPGSKVCPDCVGNGYQPTECLSVEDCSTCGGEGIIPIWKRSGEEAAEDFKRENLTEIIRQNTMRG